MIIRTKDRDIKVIAVYDDILMEGKYTFPALRFEFEGNVSKEDIEALTSGSFDIVNDLGEVLGTHEGYNKLNKVSVSIAKVTTAEEQVVELQNSLNNAEATISANQEEIQALEVENAELLFSTLTNEDLNSVTEEETGTENGDETTV